MFSNIDLSSYYTKTEVDDIDNELSALILNTYTKTEIDTSLSDYSTISYLQGNYMTTLSITETLMNNYASLTLIGDNSYDKLYLDNQFSLKADASTTYNKTETDTMLLSYTTGSYVDDIFYIKLKLITYYQA